MELLNIFSTSWGVNVVGFLLVTIPTLGIMIVHEEK